MQSEHTDLSYGSPISRGLAKQLLVDAAGQHLDSLLHTLVRTVHYGLVLVHIPQVSGDECFNLHLQQGF